MALRRLILVVMKMMGWMRPSCHQVSLFHKHAMGISKLVLVGAQLVQHRDMSAQQQCRMALSLEHCWNLLSTCCRCPLFRHLTVSVSSKEPERLCFVLVEQRQNKSVFVQNRTMLFILGRLVLYTRRPQQ
jgi:hypothetical protein